MERKIEENNSQRAACRCSATSFRNDPGELLPAQIHCVTGID
jgi:hypothetical protein